MADPTSQQDFPSGSKLHPNAQADVPADFGAKYAAGDPYVAIVVPQDDDATRPKYLYTTLLALGVGTQPVTVEDGSGGFLIVFDENGDVVYA